MNLKPLIIDKLKEYCDNSELDYSVGQILYSTLAQIKTPNFKKSDLLRMSDEMLYKAMCKSLNKEQE